MTPSKKSAFGWLKYLYAAPLVLALLFVFRPLFITHTAGNALPQIFMALAATMGLFALHALYLSLRGMFGGASTVDATRSSLPERAALVDEKNALLRAIKDIAFEHDVGKLSDEEFQRLDRSYRARAKEVLQKLDEDLLPFLSRAERLLEDQKPPKIVVEEPDAKAKKKKHKKKKDAAKPDVKAILTEMAREHFDDLSRERGLGALPDDAKIVEVCHHCGTQNELLAPRCKACDARLASSVCPKCEAVNAPDARFCNKCATAIPDDAEAVP